MLAAACSTLGGACPLVFVPWLLLFPASRALPVPQLPLLLLPPPPPPPLLPPPLPPPLRALQPPPLLLLNLLAIVVTSDEAGRFPLRSQTPLSPSRLRPLKPATSFQVRTR